MKRISFFAIVLVLLFIIFQLITSIYTLWHKQDVLIQATEELQQQKKEHANLESQLQKVKSNAFVDEEARDKLLLTKPGQADVLINSSLLALPQSARKEAAKPNWQQWLDLFW